LERLEQSDHSEREREETNHDTQTDQVHGDTSESPLFCKEVYWLSHKKAVKSGARRIKKL
jgi:hypothetical protein